MRELPSSIAANNVTITAIKNAIIAFIHTGCTFRHSSLIAATLLFRDLRLRCRKH
jgi:hypothetical protein